MTVSIKNSSCERLRKMYAELKTVFLLFLCECNLNFINSGVIYETDEIITRAPTAGEDSTTLTKEDFENAKNLDLSNDFADDRLLANSDLFEGDIEGFDSETRDIEEFVERDNEFYLTGGKSATRDASKLWSNGRIPYRISTQFTASERSKIAAAFAEFHDKTCVRFVGRVHEYNYLMIEKKFQGCWTYVGKVAANYDGSETVSLPTSCVGSHGIILHLLFHTAGFFHEHSRNDRDDYVEIHKENLSPRVYEQNFKKYDLKRIDHLGAPYDYGSIVHYGSHAFSTNGKTTITKKLQTGPEIGQRKHLSEWDAFKINKLYNCPQAKTTPTTTTTTTASSTTASPKCGCRDLVDFCGTLQSFCADATLQAFISRNCRQTCNMCKDVEVGPKGAC